MIYFTNGTSITNKEAADLIRKEGKLGVGRRYNPKNGLRCALGVLENWCEYGPQRMISASYDQLIENIYRRNDSTDCNDFQSILESLLGARFRARRMAKWFETLSD